MGGATHPLLTAVGCCGPGVVGGVGGVLCLYLSGLSSWVSPCAFSLLDAAGPFQGAFWVFFFLLFSWCVVWLVPLGFPPLSSVRSGVGPSVVCGVSFDKLLMYLYGFTFFVIFILPFKKKIYNFEVQGKETEKQTLIIVVIILRCGFWKIAVYILCLMGEQEYSFN